MTSTDLAHLEALLSALYKARQQTVNSVAYAGISYHQERLDRAAGEALPALLARLRALEEVARAAEALEAGPGPGDYDGCYDGCYSSCSTSYHEPRCIENAGQWLALRAALAAAKETR